MGSDKQALVLGASGISGWSLVNQCLQYPTKDTFSKIIGTTNRPLTVSEARLPNDPRIELVSGIDFSKSEAEVKDTLSSRIPSIEKTTHIFFTAYVAKPSYEELVSINEHFAQVGLSALSALCPSLESVIIQSGGKAYGVEFTDKLTLKTPFKESEPRIPEPWSKNVFYYNQCDIAHSLSNQAKWTWTEVRPDVIIGFVPNDNAMDGARGIAFYLSLYRHIHGPGATVPFIGNARSFINKHTDTFQDILSRFEIYAALHPDKCGQGNAFNIADGNVTTWSEKWPALCSYFGLKGVGPETNPQTAAEFVEENGKRWKEVEKQHDLRQGLFEKYEWSFIAGICEAFDFDREYDLSKVREVGFEEEIDTVEGWTTAFGRLRDAGVIPA